MRSPELAALWSRHAVRECTFGPKEFHHPPVGELELVFEMLSLPDSAQRLLTYSAAPGSASEAALRLPAVGTAEAVGAAAAATAPR